MADQLRTVQTHLSAREGGWAGWQAARAFFFSLFLYSSIKSRACMQITGSLAGGAEGC